MLQTVQRRSLRSIMPDAAAVFRNLFATLDIQEPAFKNVVVLYRRKIADKPECKSEYEPVRAHDVVCGPLRNPGCTLPSAWIKPWPCTTAMPRLRGRTLGGAGPMCMLRPLTCAPPEGSLFFEDLERSHARM